MSKTILKQGKFIRFVRKDTWEYTERINSTGVAVIFAMTKDNKVILVEQYRTPVGKKVIECPAGLMGDHDKNETLSTAAKRELLEETGYKARNIVKLFTGPVSSGSSSGILTFVRATNVIKVGEGGGDKTENIITHVIPIDKVELWLKKMERKGRLISPRIYIALYFLKKLI